MYRILIKTLSTKNPGTWSIKLIEVHIINAIFHYTFNISRKQQQSQSLTKRSRIVKNSFVAKSIFEV